MVNSGHSWVKRKRTDDTQRSPKAFIAAFSNQMSYLSLRAQYITKEHKWNLSETFVSTVLSDPQQEIKYQGLEAKEGKVNSEIIVFKTKLPY